MGDLLLLWQILLMVGGLVLVVIVLPRLIGHLYRINDQVAPSWVSRFGAIFLLMVAAIFVLPTIFWLVLLPLAFLQSGDGALFGFVFIFVLFTGLTSFYFWKTICSWSMPLKKLWLPFLLAIGVGFAFDACAMKTLGRMRDLGLRSVDLSNLRQIDTALHLYYDEYKCYPDNLGRLVEGDFTASFTLTSPFSGRENIKPVSTRPYQGPIDFTYIRLPESAPKDLIWIWENPDYFNGEGGWVLYFSDEVKWLKIEEFREQVARTQTWLNRLTTSAPAEKER